MRGEWRLWEGAASVGGSGVCGRRSGVCGRSRLTCSRALWSDWIQLRYSMLAANPELPIVVFLNSYQDVSQHSGGYLYLEFHSNIIFDGISRHMSTYTVRAFSSHQYAYAKTHFIILKFPFDLPVFIDREDVTCSPL